MKRFRSLAELTERAFVCREREVALPVAPREGAAGPGVSERLYIVERVGVEVTPAN